MLLFSLGISSVGNSAYATNTTGASSNQGVATSISNKWVKITTSGNVSMSIVPLAGDGSLAAAKGTVNVKTNSGSGYQLYLSGSLYDTGDTNHWAGLYKNSSTANPSIASITSTATAAALAVNEWGYAIPSVSGDGYAAADLYQSAVDGENITSTTIMDQLKWKGVKGDYQHILTSTNTADTMSTTGEDTDIYYGVRINNAKATGNYTNVLVYTAFIDGGTSVNMTPEVLPIVTEGSTTTVTFETGHESSSNPVTPSQIEVSLFNSADANATVATCNTSTIKIVSGHDGTSGQPLQFTCTVTRNLATSYNDGALYDVIVRIDKENNGLYMTYEHQDYWRFSTQWSYSLSFDGNGATSGVPTSQTGSKLENQSYSYTLPANPTRTYYTFDNWSDGINTYVYGNTITLAEADPTKTLTANWNEIPVTYTLNYAAGGFTISNSSSFPAQTAAQNRSVGTTYTFDINPTIPTTTDDATFLCWSEDGTNCLSDDTTTITLTSTSDSDIDVSKTLTALWAFTATVNYDANGGSDAPSATTAAISGSGSVTLDTTEPTRSGYTFIGWASAASVPHTTYGDTMTVSSSSPTITVYAEWIANTDNLTDGGDMQDASCSNLTHGELYSMTDTRTSTSYLVAKLADGNCWMLQNLYLTSAKILDSSTSDVSESFKLPSSAKKISSGMAMYVGTHEDATPDTAITVSGTTASNTGSYFGVSTANAANSSTAGKSLGSVCPKGWHLPTYADSSDTNQFYALSNAYSENTAKIAQALKTADTGYCSNTTCPYVGSAMYYYSEYLNSANGYKGFYSSPPSFTPQAIYYSTTKGVSVRCVLAS